jgi:hypothetical protein
MTTQGIVVCVCVCVCVCVLYLCLFLDRYMHTNSELLVLDVNDDAGNSHVLSDSPLKLQLFFVVVCETLL